MYYPNKRQSIYLVIKVILIMLGVYLVGYGLPYIIKFKKPLYYDEILEMMSAFAFIPVILYAKKRGGISFQFKIAHQIFDKDLLVFIVFAILASILLIPFSNLIDLYSYIFNDGSFRLSFSFSGTTLENLFKAVELFIFAPLFEEVLFRGVILKQLLKQYSRNNALIFVGILFAVGHATIFSFIWILIVGILLCVIYTRTKSLLKCVVFHVILNFVDFFVNVN